MQSWYDAPTKLVKNKEGYFILKKKKKKNNEKKCFFIPK